MNQARRGFLKTLALLPLAVVPVKVNGEEGHRREMSEGKFIFCFPHARQETLNEIKQYLDKNGYQDALVVGGGAVKDFQIYKMSQQPVVIDDVSIEIDKEGWAKIYHRLKRDKRI